MYRDNIVDTRTTCKIHYFVSAQVQPVLEDMILVQVSPLTPELIKEALRNNYDKPPPHPADDKDSMITYPDWSWKGRTDKKAVIVDRICAEAVLKGANIFVNGIRSQN